MVSNLRLAVFVACCAPLLSVVAACAAGQPAQDSGTTYRAPTRVQPTPAPTPINDCTGVTTDSQALSEVQGGFAMALISADVSGDPVQRGANSQQVPLANVQVLGGVTPYGLPTSVLETGVGSDNLLPRGSYVLLLGGLGDNEGQYFLADGLEGSFAVDGNQATQRCPNYNDPSNILMATDSVSIDQLTSEFAAAFKQDPESPMPTSPISTAPTAPASTATASR